MPVFPRVARVTANNPGPFTFHGTNSYLVGERELAVIDPGPENDEHFDALVRADCRSPGHAHPRKPHASRSFAARCAAEQGHGRTGHAEGPHRPARNPPTGTPLDSGADTAFKPDIALADGDLVAGEGWALRTVLTPGHTANHSAFALEGTGLLFSADHVMAWSTTIVAPPDGSMADYMASLDRLIERDDRLLLPGHGGPVKNPHDYLRGLREHRLARERAILDRLTQGDRSIDELVRAIYRDTDPNMHAAAGLSVLAHLEDLVDRKLVATEGAPSIGGIFRPV